MSFDMLTSCSQGNLFDALIRTGETHHALTRMQKTTSQSSSVTEKNISDIEFQTRPSEKRFAELVIAERNFANKCGKHYSTNMGLHFWDFLAIGVSPIYLVKNQSFWYSSELAVYSERGDKLRPADCEIYCSGSYQQNLRRRTWTASEISVFLTLSFVALLGFTIASKMTRKILNLQLFYGWSKKLDQFSILLTDYKRSSSLASRIF